MTFCLVIASLSAQAQRLSVSATTIDCGKTGFMVPVSATFEIRNKGLRKLVIRDTKADCGCVAAELSKRELGPGERATLKIVYDARLLGHFEKQVALYHNASKEPTYLKMKGVVLSEVADYSHSYPFSMGNLLSDKNVVEFDNVNKGDQPFEVINILNGSSMMMTPNIQHLPNYLSASVSPETLSPGQAGKVTLTLHSRNLADYGLTQTTVYLASNLGDKVSPENELPVSVVLLPDLKSFEGTNKQYAPRLVLSSDKLDLGMIGKKLQKKGVITLTNKGRTKLNISSMQLFTGGLEVTLAKRELMPGEQTKMKVSIDRDFLLKSRTRPRILMITNDPDHSKVIISVNVK